MICQPLVPVCGSYCSEKPQSLGNWNQILDFINRRGASPRTVWGVDLNAFMPCLTKCLHGFQHRPVASRRSLDHTICLIYS